MPYKDPKKRLEAQRSSRKNKPDHYRERAKQQGRKRSNAGYFLERRYGLSIEDYNKMVESQKGVCAICHNPPKGTHPKTMKLHVDHDHTSGKVRGLLCNKCNIGLGIIEQREFVMQLQEYLENHTTPDRS